MFNSKTLKTLEYNKILTILASFASSETGKLSILALTPETSYEKANEALALTIEADSVLYKHAISPVFNYDDVSDCILRSRKLSLLTMGEILRVGRLLKVSRTVSSSMLSINDSSLTQLKSMSEEVFISFTLEKDIFRCILSDKEMADNASSELKSIRQSILRLNDRIKEKLNSYITSSAMAKYLQDNIITMRSDRYVIPIKIEHRGQVQGLIHDQSSSGSTVFVEPMMIVELNNDLRIMMANEEKEIERILRDFTSRISKEADNILKNQSLLTIMDTAFAKALYAKSIKAVPASVNSYGNINIIKGRHPLIDKGAVVPVSVLLGANYHILMITGPNTGGKTVTLKLTGLLTLMGLSGMFIPAEEGSTISIFDNIWCDIGDEQSIEQSLSTFSSHMLNIISILNNLSGKSLILLDELGAGTDPQEGAALAMAITSYLIANNAFAIITTHYPELKEYALITDGIENASMDFDPDTFKPTFHLVIGVPGASNAIQIAQRLGLNTDIVDSARGLLSQDKIQLEQVLIQAESARRRLEQTKEEMEQGRESLKLEEIRLNEEKKAIISEKEKIKSNALKQTKQLISHAMEEANSIVSQLKEMQDNPESMDIFKANKLRKQLENIRVESSDNDIKTKITELKGEIIAGDKVYVKSIDNYGIVENINRKGELLVKIGSVSTTILPSDVVRISKDKKTEVKISVTRPHSSEAIQSEINLIGQTIDEALYNLDIFINNAAVKGVSEIRIIHGKGAGILRQAVYNYLKESLIVKEHRIGNYTEGQSGVTIAKL